MIKTLIAIMLMAAPAGAAEFSLQNTSAADIISMEAAITVPAAKVAMAERLSVSEIENRWIASILVTGQRLSRLAANANGIAPHSAPPGLAIELGTLARRTLEGAEKMHYAALDGRWNVVAFEADKLDRVAAGVREWAAEAKAHHNAAALKAGELSAAAEDLASALSWLRRDSGLKVAPQPAVMPAMKLALSCSSR